MISIGRFPASPPDPPAPRKPEPLASPLAPTPYDLAIAAFERGGPGSPFARAALAADGRALLASWASNLARAEFPPERLIALLTEMGGEPARFVVSGVVALASGRQLKLSEIDPQPNAERRLE